MKGEIQGNPHQPRNVTGTWLSGSAPNPNSANLECRGDEKTSPMLERSGRWGLKGSREDQVGAEEERGAFFFLRCQRGRLHSNRSGQSKRRGSFGSDARSWPDWLTSALHQRGTVTGYYRVDRWADAPTARRTGTALTLPPHSHSPALGDMHSPILPERCLLTILCWKHSH